MGSKKLFPCPECGEAIARRVEAVQRHFLKAHMRFIADAEALRMAVPGPKGRAGPTGVPDETLSRQWAEVQGGAPGLKRR